MSSINEEAVRHVAYLARLKTNEAQVALFSSQLSRILEFVDQLNQVDTTNVEPTAHPLPIANVFRDDVPHQPWKQDSALANAPDTHLGQFRVPKVFES